MLLSDVAHRLLDLCFPRTCPGCDRGHERPGLYCDPCERLLQDLESMPACAQCGRPLPMPGSPCPTCKGRGLRPFERVLSLGVHREPVRTTIHQVKYAGRWHLAEALADRLVDAKDVGSWLDGADALVPVPLHSRRQAERGFNQADVIARRIGRRCGVPVWSPAARVRDTPTQATLKAMDARADNLRGAFRVVDPRQVRGRRLVIVDDVSTTGATLSSFGRALRAERPGSLAALVLTVADPRGRDFAYA